MAPPNHTLPHGPRGQGVELWLLRPGKRRDLDARLVAFARLAPAQVLGPPEGEGAHWAKAFAAAHSVPPELLPEFLPRLPLPGDEGPGEASSARAWSALERALARGPAAVLALLPDPLLGQVVARALGFPLERSSALRVDPGRAVLLRDDPVGIVLRHSNVLEPEALPGEALPDTEVRPGARAEPPR